MHIDHNHSHENDHVHVHEHVHISDNESCHDSTGTPRASAKDLALLKYMLEHNRQHAQELADTGNRLADTGLSDAAEMIGEALHYFDHANEKLEKAVESLVV